MIETTCHCAICNKEFPVEELHLLPEMEAFARTSALAQLGAELSPELPSETELTEKYGYGHNDLFCSPCMKVLLTIAQKRSENMRKAGGR